MERIHLPKLFNETDETAPLKKKVEFQIRDCMVTNYGEGGELQNGRGGARDVLPLRKGGMEKVLAMLKGGGQRKCWGSFLKQSAA